VFNSADEIHQQYNTECKQHKKQFNALTEFMHRPKTTLTNSMNFQFTDSQN